MALKKQRTIEHFFLVNWATV